MLRQRACAGAAPADPAIARRRARERGIQPGWQARPHKRRGRQGPALRRADGPSRAPAAPRQLGHRRGFRPGRQSRRHGERGRDRPHLADGELAGCCRTLHHGSPVSSLSFSTSGDRVVTAGGRDVRVWQTRTGRRIRDIQVASGAHSASLSPDGRAVVVVGRDRFARVYAVPDGRLLFQSVTPRCGDERRLQPERERARDDEPGSHLGSVGRRDGSAFAHPPRPSRRRPSCRLQPAWEAARHNQRGQRRAGLERRPRLRRSRRCSGHTNAVVDAAFSPDATHIVTASDDHDARVWETAGGHARTVLRGHTGPVLTASFDRSGSRVVTSSADGTTRVWDPGTADTLHLIGRQRGPILDAAANASGTLVA